MRPQREAEHRRINAERLEALRPPIWLPRLELTQPADPSLMGNQDVVGRFSPSMRTYKSARADGLATYEL
jgi:hypothetical protein